MARHSTKPDGHNIVQIIRDHYPQLNDTLKKIADFILQNIEKATYSSLMEISKEVGVSDASLIRFAREMGYKGYQDLREDLVLYIRKIIYPYEKAPAFSEQGSSPILDLAMKSDIEYITKTISSIDGQTFESMTDMIVGARKVFCMGWGCSSFLAEYLAFGLKYLSYDAVSVIRERRPLVQQLMFMQEPDILIVFDLIFYSAEVLEAVEFIRKRNKKIKIVTITNDPLAEVVQHSDLSFFCDIVGHKFKLISLTAPLCLINAIVEQCVIKDPERTGQALVELQQAVEFSPLHFAQFDPQNFQWKVKRNS